MAGVRNSRIPLAHAFDLPADDSSVGVLPADGGTAPTLTALHLDPVDVTNRDNDLTVSGSAADADGDVQSITLTLDRAVMVQGYEGHGITTAYPVTTVSVFYPYDGPDGHAFSRSTLLDRTTKAGDYSIVSAVVIDAAGNSTTYSTADLAAHGFDTHFHVSADSTPPVLTGLTLPSADPNSADFNQFSLTATDSGSVNTGLFAVVNLDHGIATSGFPQIHLNMPVSDLLGTYFYQITSGTPSALTISPTVAENPSYNVTGVALIDSAGNEVDYSPDQLRAMGFQTHFVTGASAFFEASAGAETMVAPVSGDAYFQGDNDAASTVVLNGNVGDYTLSRLQPTNLTPHASQVGAFVLTATNGTGSYTIEESVGGVRFQDGQYLSTHDLPAYLVGDSALRAGGDGHDVLFQDPAKAYQLFLGGAGSDDVYLNGNVGDYVLGHFTAATGPDLSGTASVDASGPELVARNGSGALLIGSDVEFIHFRDGQYLAAGDLAAYIASDPQHAADDLAIGFDGSPGSEPDRLVDPSARVLVNGNVGDYTLSRDYLGNFLLTGSNATAGTVSVSEEAGAVQFANGRYLALHDLSAYVAGSDVYTAGAGRNDVLIASTSGDQYIYGATGTDDLFLHGNTHDYTIMPVENAGPGITGYELVANNGSGNLYIDQSVETVHFQDGQYLAFADLPAYVDPFHGQG